MALAARSAAGEWGAFAQLRLARQVVRGEGQTLFELADRLGDDFCQAADLVYVARGSVIVSVTVPSNV